MEVTSLNWSITNSPSASILNSRLDWQWKKRKISDLHFSLNELRHSKHFSKNLSLQIALQYGVVPQAPWKSFFMTFERIDTHFNRLWVVRSRSRLFLRRNSATWLCGFRRIAVPPLDWIRNWQSLAAHPQHVHRIYFFLCFLIGEVIVSH